MSTARLEQRVAALENQYARLLEIVGERADRDGWRAVVGIFADDPDIAELHEETRRIREADRAATRNSNETPL